MSTHLISIFTATVLALALLASVGCGGKTPPAVTPGTGPVGLPPLPEDLATDTYQGDAYLSRACESTASGMGNCVVWLRENATARLIDYLEHDITDRLASESRPTVESGSQGNGGFGESSTIERSIAREAALSLALRYLESPILALQDGQHYAMRVLVVRDETDYRILTAMMERAERQGRGDLAGRYRARIQERFGDRGPSQSKIQDVVARVGGYYAALWESTQKRKGDKR